MFNLAGAGFYYAPKLIFNKLNEGWALVKISMQFIRAVQRLSHY